MHRRILKDLGDSKPLYLTTVMTYMKHTNSIKNYRNILVNRYFILIVYGQVLVCSFSFPVWDNKKVQSEYTKQEYYII